MEEIIMKRSRKLISILCVLSLLLTFSLSVSAFTAENEKDEKVQDILSRVLESTKENNLFTLEEVKYVLDHDSAAGNQILDQLDEISIPADANLRPETTFDSMTRQAERPHYSVQYNPETGEEKTVFEDDFYLEAPIQHTEAVSDTSASLPLLTRPQPRAFQEWYESDPQNWSDVKSAFKLFVRPQDGGPLIYGSAFRISNNYLGTAGHCLYNPDSDGLNGWAGSIICVPAYRTSDPRYPLGSTYQVSGNMSVGGNWKNYGSYDDDWGVLQLQTPISTGWMGKKCVGNDDSLDGQEARAIGYPAGNGRMFISRGIVQNTGRRQVVADYSVYKGMSGGPIADENAYIYGIITWGDFDPDKPVSKPASSGGFVKFDDWIFNKMCSYN